MSKYRNHWFAASVVVGIILFVCVGQLGMWVDKQITKSDIPKQVVVVDKVSGPVTISNPSDDKPPFDAFCIRLIDSNIQIMTSSSSTCRRMSAKWFCCLTQEEKHGH